MHEYTGPAEHMPTECNIRRRHFRLALQAHGAHHRMPLTHRDNHLLHTRPILPARAVEMGQLRFGHEVGVQQEPEFCAEVEFALLALGAKG
jgi:hypothetical protein